MDYILQKLLSAYYEDL